MVTGKFIVRHNNENYDVKIEIPGRKPIKFRHVNGLIEEYGQNIISLNNKSVQVELIDDRNDPVLSITLNDTVIYQKYPPPAPSTDAPLTLAEQLRAGLQEQKPVAPQRVEQPELEMEQAISIRQIDRHGHAEAPAVAPYNFIPLNKTVVEAEPVPAFNDYHKDRLTGTIQLNLTTKTPLYIRDLMTLEQVENGEKSRFLAGFFAPNGRPQIPGSSLRGMVRTLVEIVSFGKFENFDDRRLYYRDVAGTSSLKESYSRTMVDSDDQYFPKIGAGVLKEIGTNKYCIHPSKIEKDTQIYRINFDRNTGKVDGSQDLYLKDGAFKFQEVYYQPVEPQSHTHHRFNKKTQKKDIPYQLKYAKLHSVSRTEDHAHPQKGYIVASGKFNSKHMHWVMNEPDYGKSLDISKALDSYQKDSSRDEKADLLRHFKTHEEVPCFYILDEKGQVSSFGHTGMFRLAYENTIGDHVPSELKEGVLDISTAIFGSTDCPGRVFFEDAMLNGDPKQALMGKAFPQILASPKPTSFQHYLVQTNDNLNRFPQRLAHYDAETKTAIRGYKLYWHKSGNEWIEKAQTKLDDDAKKSPEKRQYTEINPVKANQTFTGHIHFENLSPVELGALLFVLALPNGCYHKLGMGKPLGLGSVEIQPELYLSNRTNRYQNLLAEWDQELETGDTGSYIQAFENYIKAGAKLNVARLWDDPRLKELKTMLDGNIRERKSTRYRYMELDDFKKRPVLPLPSQVSNPPRPPTH